MPKIYTYARNMILAIVAQLNVNHSFEHKELYWKDTKVTEGLVCFEISPRIKELLETITMDSEEGAIVFVPKDNIWEAQVSANNVESYFFARMLFMALAKLRSGIIEVPNTNCEIIEMYTKQSLVRNMKDFPLGLIIKARLDESDGQYKVSVPIKGSIASFANRNVDMLCMRIVEHFKGKKKL